MNQALRKHHMTMKYLMSEAVSAARYTFHWYIAHLQSSTFQLGDDFRDQGMFSLTSLSMLSVLSTLRVMQMKVLFCVSLPGPIRLSLNHCTDSTVCSKHHTSL